MFGSRLLVLMVVGAALDFVGRTAKSAAVSFIAEGDVAVAASSSSVDQVCAESTSPQRYTAGE